MVINTFLNQQSWWQIKTFVQCCRAGLRYSTTVCCSATFLRGRYDWIRLQISQNNPPLLPKCMKTFDSGNEKSKSSQRWWWYQRQSDNQSLALSSCHVDHSNGIHPCFNLPCYLAPGAGPAEEAIHTVIADCTLQRDRDKGYRLWNV